MRLLLTFFLIWSVLLANAQSTWNKLFRADPEMSDGYFILDRDKADALGVVEVEVNIMASEIQSNGEVRTSVIENLDLSDGFYARLDFSLWDNLANPFRIHYTARGLDASGNVVVDVQTLCAGCLPWPEVCRETCESILYAYTLVAYSDGTQAVVELHEGTVNGEATRVYVKSSDWQTFQNMFNPWDDFGIGGGQWSQIQLLAAQGIEPYASDIILLQYPSQTPPASARNYEGYLLGNVTENVYAVKKGKGQWRDLHAVTEVMASQAVCLGQDNLRMVYNSDDLVQDALMGNDMDSLTCMGMLASGGGLGWGSAHDCTDYHIDEQTWGNPPNFLGAITLSVVGCVTFTYGFDPNGTQTPSGTGPNGTYALADVANIVVSHWTVDTRTQVLTVPVKGIGDPKLLKVSKTEVPGGLYEFMLIMNDGRILTRVVEFAGPTILNADFAAFTLVNIYPVPVKDTRFAIDLDLPAPMSITITIINNEGNQCYTKALSFDLAGKNKHVVEMGSGWPNGLYHTIIQYPDGSAENVSFTVDH